MKKLTEAQHELTAAQEAAQEARAAYEAAIDRGDMEAATQAQQAAHRADADAERWADRIAVIDAEKAQADQRRADKRLAEAVAAAEKAAEAERQLSAEVGDIVERMAAVFAKLKNADSEAFRACRAAHAAADNAGRERPRIRRTPIKADSDVLALMKWAKHFAGLADSQARSCLTVSEQARRKKAG